MTPTEAGLYGFVILIALMFLKIPVGFVMALVGFGCSSWPRISSPSSGLTT